MSRILPAAAVSRRSFLGHAAGGLSAAAAVPTPAARRVEVDATIAFFVVGDTHFFADAAAPDRLHDRSAAVTGALVDRLNALPGQEIPERSGGGVVREPFGVIHAGDVIDTGDKQGKLQAAMQRTSPIPSTRSTATMTARPARGRRSSGSASGTRPGRGSITSRRTGCTTPGTWVTCGS